jgi:hypothetical protein
LPLSAIVTCVGEQTQHLYVDLPGPPERLQSGQATFDADQLAQLSQPAIHCQPAGQLVQGVVIASAGALAKLTGLIALGQPAGKPKLGDVLPGICQRADQRDSLPWSAALTHPAGKLLPRMIVAGVGSLAQLINLTVLGQAVRLPPPGRIARFPGW